MENKNEKNVKDVCVLCGNTTQYSIFENIDYRENYVEGVGQLCNDCSNKIYKDNLR